MSSIRQRNGLAAFEKELAEKEQRAQDEREKPIRAQVQRNAELQAQIEETEREIARQELMKQDSPELAKRCKKFNLKRHGLSSQTPVGELREMIRRAFDESNRQIEASGFRLEHPAYGETIYRIMANNPELDWLSTETWLTVFEYAQSVGYFDRAVTKIEQPKAPEQEKPRTLEDIHREIDNLDSSTRDGALNARRLAVEGTGLAWRHVFSEWKNQLAHDFHYQISDNEAQACIDYCKRNGLGIDEKSLNLCRQHVLGLKDKSERLASEVEQFDWAHATFEESQAMKRRMREEL
ncbi:MAG: hypothetical protein C5B59_00525 [Bacteroidetes bacterium]|nr:MAG: hypothetical protein C5B59_00525 [Bacteroidota bacterium]